METTARWRRTGRRGLRGPGGLLGGALVLLGLTGCARALTIYQDKYVNTGPQVGQPVDKRTGEPLELAIVCVYPRDLDKEANADLRPDNERLTVRDWYEKRPLSEGPKPNHFILPEKQVFVMTDARECYGTRIGKDLRGTAHDGTAPIHKTVNFSLSELHNSKSVIYVFPRFMGSDGLVLKVPPVKFTPPGAYTRDLEIKIGVKDDGTQYITIPDTCPRKLYVEHGK